MQIFARNEILFILLSCCLDKKEIEKSSTVDRTEFCLFETDKIVKTNELLR